MYRVPSKPKAGVGEEGKTFLGIALAVALAALSSGGVLWVRSRTNQSADQKKSVAPKKTENPLLHSSSPFLRLGAKTLVHWYPWGEEAFEKARRENKPIHLDIGYSTCHWCHVMDEESFSDKEVAALLNETFVNVLVDREERPDLDALYMNVALLLTGSGGWPLTIFMTPDRKPFFAGTYIPKENRFGRVGWLELTPRVHNLWETQHEKIVLSAEKITRALQQASASAKGRMDASTLKSAYEKLAQSYDHQYGGFGSAPKFPSPHNFLFLMQYYGNHQVPEALKMVEQSLRQLRLGGIFDQIGNGFHRYSTDPYWRVPHFEKMLYDQALLALAYLDAYRLTHKPFYATGAREIFHYVLQRMTSPQGGFYSAEDADSQDSAGKLTEGAFYTWQEKELQNALSDRELQFVEKHFHITAEGNVQLGPQGERTNIFYLTEALLPSQQKTWASIRKKLYALREKRKPPLRDEKILADWNGLMITALTRGAWVLSEPKYAQAAEKAMDFILQNIRKRDGTLQHNFFKGKLTQHGFLDDYAFVIQGLLELYRATFSPQYLAMAKELSQKMWAIFWDKKGGGFFMAASNPHLITQPKEVYDGALPSGNSVAALDFMLLSEMTGEVKWAKRASELFQSFAAQVRHNPSAYTELLQAFQFALGPTYEIVVAGDLRSADTRAMLNALSKTYLPQSVLLLKPGGADDEAIARLAPFTASQSAKEGRATAYVCQNYKCSLPTQSIPKMMALLHARL